MSAVPMNDRLSKPVIDDGQQPAAPQGQAIGADDTSEQFDSDTPTQTVAEQIGQAAISFQQERTGHSPQAATVVLNENALVVTLHTALSPAEQAIAQSPDGATQVQESHRQLLMESCEPLRQEIERITGADTSKVSATDEMLAGTVVQEFELADPLPKDKWSGNSPVGCS